MNLPKHWEYFEETTSTNDTLHRVAQAGAPQGTVHIASAQTRGRGRVGRSWWSPPGSGLWMSLLLRPRLEPAGAAGISLVAGRALKAALQPLTPLPIELYWPNDLMIRGKKLAGILGELRGQGEKYWIALGIGVNLDLRHAPPPAGLEGRTISLAEAGVPAADRELVALAQRCTGAFWPLYGRFEAGESVAALVGEELAHVGCRVSIRSNPEKEWQEWRGVVAGLGSRGELLVRDESGALQSVSAGEVVYEEG
ncbi:MAG: biotin--[acetyl-CoA-carboxylase] ligase [Planctomycetes bacterium]|nr:biotin--[acetyl-CoA-carboxylase] ligase [Planctomycetota bacterium]